MKKLIAIPILCLCTLITFAQSNTIKLNVLALALTNISIQDEYTINGNSSVALGVSYLPKRGVPGPAISDDPSNNAKNLKFSGFSITPEYRYYFKGNGPKGLYLAGYVRYAKYSVDDYDFTYDRDNGTTGSSKYTGDYTATVVGIMLGSQWLLGDKWTLDWWIIGAAFGSQKGEFTAEGDFTAADQQDIKDEVETIDTPGVDVTVETSATTTKLTVEPSYPAIRGFGLCLGYKF